MARVATKVRRTIGYAVLGILSGFLSIVIMSYGQSHMTIIRIESDARIVGFWDRVQGWFRDDALFSLAPGVTFGLLVGWALWRMGRFDGSRAAGFFVAATTAMLLMLETGYKSMMLSIDGGYWHKGVLAGLLGGGVFAVLTALLLPEFRRLVPAAVLVATGLALGPATMQMLTFDEYTIPVLFIPIWQGGYAAVIGALLTDSPKARAV